uniref:YTH domain-containing protein n=1 Tax=Loa loa TaxID=7209 RepID=A0A1I7V5A9_LOALO
MINGSGSDIIIVAAKVCWSYNLEKPDKFGYDGSGKLENFWDQSAELRPSTSSTSTVERGVEYSLADAADQGPPAKKPRQNIFSELAY